MKDKAPYFELDNSLSPDNSPIGYPDLSGKLPSSYPKLNPPKREYVYHSGPMSHSVNPAKDKFAEMSELARMKLAK